MSTGMGADFWRERQLYPLTHLNSAIKSSGGKENIETPIPETNLQVPLALLCSFFNFNILGELPAH